MLVISVIVAIAILGVLLGIIGGLNVTTNDPKTIMTDGLKKIQPAGYGNTDPVTANFKKDSFLDAQAFVGALPIDPNQVGFNCVSATDFCTKNFDLTDPVTSADNARIYAKSNIAAFIVVCGDSSATTTLNYCAGVGAKGKDANDACSACLALNARTTTP